MTKPEKFSFTVTIDWMKGMKNGNDLWIPTISRTDVPNAPPGLMEVIDSRLNSVTNSKIEE